MRNTNVIQNESVEPRSSRKAGVIANYKGMPGWHDYQLPIKLTAAARTKTHMHIAHARYQAAVNATELRKLIGV